MLEISHIRLDNLYYHSRFHDPRIQTTSNHTEASKHPSTSRRTHAATSQHQTRTPLVLSVSTSFRKNNDETTPLPLSLSLSTPNTPATTPFNHYCSSTTEPSWRDHGSVSENRDRCVRVCWLPGPRSKPTRQTTRVSEMEYFPHTRSLSFHLSSALRCVA